MHRLSLPTAAAAVALCTVCAQVQAAMPAPSVPAVTVAEPASLEVHEQGLVGVWFPPRPGKPRPAILVLGGSEGGDAGARYLGSPLAKQGYAVFGPAYFKAPGLPDNLQDVPLEYFDKAIAWMKAQPGVDPDRLAVYGGSVGGELALLLASRHPELKAVVAGVPSGWVWQGISLTSWEPHSSFDAGGKPLAYVPYDTSKPFSSVLDLYQRSLPAAAAHPDAAIPVEKIDGPVMLISGGKDQIWPSTEMSREVIKRLDAHGFRFEHLQLDYPEAGHGVATPPSDDPRVRALDSLGGTSEANASARADMWPKVLAFLDRALDPRQEAKR